MPFPTTVLAQSQSIAYNGMGRIRETQVQQLCQPMSNQTIFRFLLVSAALLWGGLPVPAADNAVDVPIDIPYRKSVLKNGLTVLVHEDHKAPIVAVNLWYHVGSKNE